jgi:hypothetical protein
MTRTTLSLIALLLTCAAPTVGCGGDATEAPPADAPTSTTASLTEGVAAAAMAPAAAPAAAEASQPAAAASMAQAVQMRSGVVKETADAAGYVYVLMGTDAGDVWIAAPAAPVEIGSRVESPIGNAMKDFKSSALDRTFESVWFVSFVRPEGSGGAVASAPTGGIAAAAHSSGGGGQAKAAPTPKAGSIEPLADGLTIAGVFGQGAGADVAVRGLVVKVNRGILGFDWVHLQDGTGSATEKTNDLLVTTAMGATVKVGDVAVARGKVATDKDFGAGYSYPLLVEGATVAVE